MHPALWKLLRLRYRATVRRTLLGLTHWRGALSFAFGVLMLAFMLGPNLYMAITAADEPQLGLLRSVAPLFLLAFTLLSLNSTTKLQAVHFWPAEVDFLFAGPFNRKELLSYKIAGNLLGALFLALLFSVWVYRFSMFWIAAYVGMFLAVWFVQLLQICIVLVLQSLTERGWPLSRKMILIVTVGILALAAFNGIRGRDFTGLQGFVDAIRQTWTGAVVLAPFDVFGRVLAAERLFPDLVLWSAVAATMNAGMFLLIVRLDANYLEASVAGSQIIYQRLQRMRSGNLRHSSPTGSVRFGLPQFPRWGGVGTIARRQFSKALRSSPWVPLIIIGAGGGGVTFFVIQSGNRGLAAILMAAAAWCTFVFASLFPFDFRGDLDQIELLKQLPIKPTALSAGQLVTPITLVGILQAAFLTSVALGTGQYQVAMLAAAFALPFDIMLFGVENLTFLIFPVRMVASTPGDFQHFGRQMLMMSIKFLLLGGLAGVSVGCGLGAFFLFGKSMTIFFIVSWLVLCVAAAATIPAVAWAFRRFDVTRLPAG